MSKQAQQNNAAAGSSSQARPPNPNNVNVRPPATSQVQGIARPAPTAAFVGGTTNPSAPSVPANPPVNVEPQRRPEPVEDEPTRRRRKMKEFLGELAPGLEMEMGITEVSAWSPLT